MVASGDVAYPGLELGDAVRVRGGRGTYVADGKVYASLWGPVAVSEGTVAVRPRRAAVAVGSEVVARVYRASAAHAVLDIIASDGAVVEVALQASLRREDAHPTTAATEAALPDMTHSFRSGDLVRARVIGADDGNRYSLSILEQGMGKLARAAPPRTS